MPTARCLVLTAALLAFGLPVSAEDFSDPTWPCVQRKVESLSMGLMWPGEVDTTIAEEDDALRSDVEELAEVLSLRRVDLEDARPRVETFADVHQDQAGSDSAWSLRASSTRSPPAGRESSRGSRNSR